VVSCALDTGKMTLAEFVEQVLKAKLGFNSPSISMSSGAVVFEEACPDEDDGSDFAPFLPLPLSSAAGGGIRHGTQLLVIDFSQNLQVNVDVIHRDVSVFEEAKSPVMFEIVNGSLPTVAATTPPAPTAAAIAAAGGGVTTASGPVENASTASASSGVAAVEGAVAGAATGAGVAAAAAKKRSRDWSESAGIVDLDSEEDVPTDTPAPEKRSNLLA